MPTPALAYLTRSGPFAAGIMVSASHNPADDNGLKVLDGDGLKLDDDAEDALEQLIWREGELVGVGNADLGRRVDASELVEAYVAHRRASPRRPGRRPAARPGRRERLGQRASGGHPRATGATVAAIHVEPDGININVRCGATDPASLAEAVVAHGADVGFALDGDADRLIAVDAGRVVDGDQVLGILALDRLSRGALPGGLVVSILSNGGLQAAVEAAGGEVIRTPVGDKYILDGMQVSGAMLGGEKSGHVIVMEHTTSGDGLVTALEVLRVMGRRARRWPSSPQRSAASPAAAGGHGSPQGSVGGRPGPCRAIADAQARLGGRGRVLVRPSGTEPALRVMVEGDDAALVSELADALAALAGERLH